MCVYFSKGIAVSTQRTYKSGKNRYIDFCEKASVTPLPVREKHLCSFVAHLANEGLKFRTIKVYLSAIRHLQIEAGMSDPFKESMPRLEYVTKGIKKHEVEKGVRERPRLPITPLLLLKMKAAWEASAASFDTKMLWAASCLCFFAFLRAGEMTVPTETAYDPAVHLGVLDLAVDDAAQPTCLRLTIKQSKTDPFRKGVNLYVGRGQVNLCPVAAVLGFLNVRGSTPGPLFVFEDGRPLTRARFAQEVRAALSAAGVDQSKYCSHSFRIGAATTAAAKGIEDSVIQTLGRWQSAAYLRYVRIPRQQLTDISGRLTQ